MPHFGLVDEDHLSEADAALLRSKLHIRSAFRRRTEGKSHHAIATLFDALEYAVRWYILQFCSTYSQEQLYILQYGIKLVPDLPDNYAAIFPICEKALTITTEFEPEETTEFFFSTVCSILQTIGIYPFDFSKLPAEVPGIY